MSGPKARLLMSSNKKQSIEGPKEIVIHRIQTHNLRERRFGDTSLSCFFFQNEERKVVSGNTESKNNILTFYLQSYNWLVKCVQMCAALFATIVLLFQQLICFQGIVSVVLLFVLLFPKRYRAVRVRPYESCYMIPNNEVVDLFIVTAFIVSQPLCVYILSSPAFRSPQQRGKSRARAFSLN